MSSFDLKNNVSASNALNIQAISSNTTVTGVSIDTKGFESATFAIQSATLTDGTYTPEVQESDDNSTFTAVADDFLIGTEANAVFVATDDNKVKTIGYAGKKRYLKLTLTSTGVTSGGTLGATAILGHPKSAPVA
jgi:allantoicase